MRTSVIHLIEHPEKLKQQLLAWSRSFREVVLLDSNAHQNTYSDFDFVLAVDALTSIQTDHYNAFEQLNQYQKTTQDWLFGYLSYDLKNDVEDLKSQNFDGLQFSELFFFQPKKLFLLRGNQLEVAYLPMCDDELEEDWNSILNQEMATVQTQTSLSIQARISPEAYLEKVQALQKHIHLGDVYEANFCMEFYAENATIDPWEQYQKLNAISHPPFAVFLRNYQHYLMSASPERYLKKVGNKLISQPIKGTAPRFEDATLDEQAKKELSINPKERSENIMIVDLVRNDLSRTASKGSVQVEELCGIHSFTQVHQMISTISSELASEFSAVDALQTTFPMGSMTGAPKISAMQIIEQLEETKRGLYSGAVGYFTPEGDFDFNVVIRSILYNEQNQYVSFSVGSAITALSVPEREYQECLVKAKAMRKVLS
ncbi:MAG: anthranilate synthase component I family protein [Bacteroidetes bacterium]|nr:anthranilate synthase component I family protein [Bacteroidota bacterium]